MIHHHFTTAQRYIMRNKIFTIINMSALALGYCLLLSLYTQDEVVCDSEYGYSRTNNDFKNVGMISDMNATSLNLRPEDETSEVETVQRGGVTSLQNFTEYEMNEFCESEDCIAEPSMSDIDNDNLHSGDPKKALV